jgi:OFA family oxalate/formate antiporter-like MFS transporter
VTQVEEGLSIKQCLRSRIFWLLLLYSCFTQFANSALQVHEMSHLVNVGISRDMAALTMTGYTGFSLVGRLGLSWLGDKHSKKNILIICAAMQAVGIFIFSYISSPWMIIAFILFYAPGFGGPIPLLPAIQADYFGTKAFATMRGLMAIGYTIPGIIGPWFAGWIADTTGSYHLAFLIYSALSACAIPIMMMTTLKRGQAPAAKVEIASAH